MPEILTKEQLSKGEKYKEEKKYLNILFQMKKLSPDWLIYSKTNCKLELDCYNEELKLAIDYNGEQHYNYFYNFVLK